MTILETDELNTEQLTDQAGKADKALSDGNYVTAGVLLALIFISIGGLLWKKRKNS